MINEKFIKGFIEMKQNEWAVNTELILPLVANHLIEVGKENGVEIEIIYGVKQEGDATIAGYYIIAPKYNKSIFQQDIYIDDESEENIKAAEEWMKEMILKLPINQHN